MPIAALLVAIDLALVVHAAKTGRLQPWAYIIMLVPVLGALAYVTIEILPAWLSTYKGQKAQEKVVRTLNPEGEYRRLRDEMAIADTIYNRAALARECTTLERYDEALALWNAIIASPQGDEPAYAVDKARAEFGSGRFQEAVATLEAVKRAHLDFRSAEAHVLYARAKEGCGLTREALDEYAAVGSYCLGAEAPVRQAQLLVAMGRVEEGRRLAQHVLDVLRRSPVHVRREQAQWSAQAKKLLA